MTNKTALAMAAGYTREITADGGPHTLFLLVEPDADLDGRYRAFDHDAQEWLWVNGWLFIHEDTPGLVVGVGPRILAKLAMIDLELRIAA